MTKTKLLSALVFILCVFVSCEKNPDEITVRLEQSGSASVKVVDSQKNPVSGANVSVSPNSAYSLFEGITDPNGEVYIEPLLQGTYLASTTVKKGNATYSDQRIIQIVTNKNTSVELYPFSNVGDVTVQLNDYYGENRVSGLNVGLVSAKEYRTGLANMVLNAISIQKSDSEGVVSFSEIPSSFEYYLFIFTDSNKELYYWNNGYIYLNKGQKLRREVEVQI